MLIACLIVSSIWTIQSCASRPYKLKYLAKSPINLVADAHLTEMNRLIKNLMVKLYKRNPDQLAKNANLTAERRVSQIFDQPGALQFEELGRLEGAEALNLCFDDQFQGDRVFAMMTGLLGMIRKSYSDQTEFFIIDTLDEQNLYNSARNIEILVWRLSSRRMPTGRAYLLTNAIDGEVQNLSFERLFGKMIAMQDMMARIMADKTNRLVTKVATTAASAFLPVGF